MTSQQETKFIRYLQILAGWSNKFKLAIEEIKALPNVDKDLALEKTLESFFIPVNRDRKIRLMSYINTGKILSKYNLMFDSHASPERPGKYSYTCPSIIIHLHGRPNQTEWNQIWKDIKESEKDEPTLKLDEILSDETMRNKRENIDLALELYALKKKGQSFQMISKQTEKLKKQLGMSKDTLYDEKETERLYERFEELLPKT